MPSVDELLEKAELNLQDLEDKTVIEDSNKYLEIDPINRKVIIPNDELIFGVTRDLNCERKYFKVARYVGNNLDMSNAHIYVNYQNANGNLYSYIVDDIKLEENTVTFSWVLSDKVVEYKGDVLFVICALWSNDDGIETNRWNTTLAKGTSLEGLKFGDIPSTGGTNVAQGTITGAGTNAVTIDTGLTSVSKIIISGSGSGESGILTLVYINGGVKSVGVSYGQYLSTISYSVGELSVNGGNVTYTPKSETATTNLMQDKEYDWIAIE